MCTSSNFTAACHLELYVPHIINTPAIQWTISYFWALLACTFHYYFQGSWRLDVNITAVCSLHCACFLLPLMHQNKLKLKLVYLASEASPLIVHACQSRFVGGRADGLYMYRQKSKATWYSKRNECTKMNGVACLEHNFLATTALATKSRILAFWLIGVAVSLLKKAA